MLFGLVGQTCHMSNTPISFLSSLVPYSSNTTLIDVRPRLCTGTFLNDLIPFESNFQSGRELTVFSGSRNVNVLFLRLWPEWKNRRICDKVLCNAALMLQLL